MSNVLPKFSHARRKPPNKEKKDKFYPEKLRGPLKKHTLAPSLVIKAVVLIVAQVQ